VANLGWYGHTLLGSNGDGAGFHYGIIGRPYSLPHCRCDKMQGVILPVVIEPAEDSAELGLQAADAAVKPSPRFLPTKLLRDRNDQWSRHRISFVTC
jgi:hypothetical protein